MEVSGQFTSWLLYPLNTPGNHSIGGWMAPRAGVNTLEKTEISCPPGIKPWLSYHKNCIEFYFRPEVDWQVVVHELWRWIFIRRSWNSSKRRNKTLVPEIYFVQYVDSAVDSVWTIELRVLCYLNRAFIATFDDRFFKLSCRFLSC
jgi:hypothetical protein